MLLLNLKIKEPVRYGQVIRLKKGALDMYKDYHKKAWPQVLKTIKRCHMKNYSIFFRDDILFGYFEYTGKNFKLDMDKMVADKKTQEWWAIMKPLQEPLETARKDEWWINMEEVFHLD